MIDKLDFLVRFWELKARHAMLGQPLVAHEQVELLSLMQLVTQDLGIPKAGPAGQTRGRLSAQLIGDGAIIPIEVRVVSAAALVVSSAGTMGAGSRAILRTADAVSGVEYGLPCTVVWVYPGVPNTMALVVDGIPTRSEFSSPTDAPARNALAWGRHERLVG